MTEELKPCPFCGGEATARGPRVYVVGGFRPLMFSCASCGAHASFDDPLCNAARERGDDSPAVAAWNRRAVRECRMEPARGGGSYCSECHVYVAPGPMTNAVEHLPARFCPNCGAKVAG